MGHGLPFCYRGTRARGGVIFVVRKTAQIGAGQDRAVRFDYWGHQGLCIFITI